MSTPTWLEEILQRPGITDICLNGAGEVYIDRGNGLEADELPAARWDEENLKAWVLDQLSRVGKSWDARFPFVDATLRSGHRLHVAFPPITRKGILVSLRKLPQLNGLDPRTSSSEAEARWGASPHYKILREAVQKGDSILVAGATGSGKTTLANDLLAHVPTSERIIALEDTPELAPAHPHFISLTSRPANADGFGEITLRTLLRQTLRMRPDRVVLGECRGAEVLELLQALNMGHHGALATLHANSPRDALRRIELLCLLAAQGALPVNVLRELLVMGIQWVVHVHRQGPVRRISELWRIEGREGDTILMRPIPCSEASLMR